MKFHCVPIVKASGLQEDKGTAAELDGRLGSIHPKVEKQTHSARFSHNAVKNALKTYFVLRFGGLLSKNCLGSDAYAVFVSSQSGYVGMLQQKAGDSSRDYFIAWDYHVFFIERLHSNTGEDETCRVYDFDCCLGFCVDFNLYIQRSFGGAQLLLLNSLPSPLFRVMSAECFIQCFSSDRSHMRTSLTEWLAPPPPYPPILSKNICNVQDGVSVEADIHRFTRIMPNIQGDISAPFGRIFCLDELVTFFQKERPVSTFCQ
eukprot:GHVS01071337.1.p1 GENE.GHVS01071337.1~~GHVS01071337.1.p1  ORF type:complete len:260 (+),score=10.94 GHVS01071337.1:434-1213(+)